MTQLSEMRIVRIEDGQLLRKLVMPTGDALKYALAFNANTLVAITVTPL